MVAFLTGRWADALAACDESERLLARSAGGAWERETARLYALISLAYLGRVRELRRRTDAVLADAEQRGDLYISASARTALSNLAWLAAGDVDAARRHAVEGERMWSRRGFSLQHYWSLMSCAQVDLYVGDGERAFARVAEGWPALARSQLLRIEVVAAEALYLRARAALASGRLAIARRDERRLSRLHAPHARGLAELVRAGLARDASAHLGAAAETFDACGMALHAHAARRVRGVLGDSSREVAATDAWMRSEEIADPSAISAMLCVMARR
jgi:hypothetical protein